MIPFGELPEGVFRSEGGNSAIGLQNLRNVNISVDGNGNVTVGAKNEAPKPAEDKKEQEEEAGK